MKQQRYLLNSFFRRKAFAQTVKYIRYLKFHGRLTIRKYKQVFCPLLVQLKHKHFKIVVETKVENNVSIFNCLPQQYAECLMESTITETTKIMSINYENLLEAPYNRHNMKRGKMCICQLIERQLRQQLRQQQQRQTTVSVQI